VEEQAHAKIYRYVVRYDAGTAPRPFDGCLTLAICKPKIRATAAPGDWVIGFRTRRPGEVLYALRVTERLTFAQYWNDPRFANRRPGRSPFPDNIYRPTAGGTLKQVSNHVHDEGGRATDVGGKHVLVSERFWYFGANSVAIPNQLLHLVYGSRGHVVHKNARPDDEAKLLDWLAAWAPGIHGEPIDGERCRESARRWQANQPRKRTC
jgi:hypothetical protein